MKTINSLQLQLVEKMMHSCSQSEAKEMVQTFANEQVAVMQYMQEMSADLNFDESRDCLDYLATLVWRCYTVVNDLNSPITEAELEAQESKLLQSVEAVSDNSYKPFTHIAEVQTGLAKLLSDEILGLFEHEKSKESDKDLHVLFTAIEVIVLAFQEHK